MSPCLPVFLANNKTSFDYYKQPYIIEHVVQSFSRKYMNVHYIHNLLYEQDDTSQILFINLVRIHLFQGE